MFEAQLLINSAESPVFTPWIPRGGNNLIWTIEVVDEALSGSGGFLAAVFHKNSEDTGPGNQVGSAITFSDPQRKDLDVSGLMELVRLRYSFDGNAAAGDWALLRSLAPVFYDAVKA